MAKENQQKKHSIEIQGSFRFGNASQMGTYGAILIQSIMNGQQNTPVNIITGTKLLIKET